MMAPAYDIALLYDQIGVVLTGPGKNGISLYHADRIMAGNILTQDPSGMTQLRPPIGG